MTETEKTRKELLNVGQFYKFDFRYAVVSLLKKLQDRAVILSLLLRKNSNLL